MKPGKSETITRAADAMSESLKVAPGRCRYCGCTETRACVLQQVGFPFTMGCWWVDRQRTVCSAPDCYQKYVAAHGAKLKGASCA